MRLVSTRCRKGLCVCYSRVRQLRFLSISLPQFWSGHSWGFEGRRLLSSDNECRQVIPEPSRFKPGLLEDLPLAHWASISSFVCMHSHPRRLRTVTQSPRSSADVVLCEVLDFWPWPSSTSSHHMHECVHSERCNQFIQTVSQWLAANVIDGPMAQI